MLANDPGVTGRPYELYYDGLIVLKVPIGVCKRRVIARKVLGGRSKTAQHWNRSDLKIHEAIKQQILSALKVPQTMLSCCTMETNKWAIMPTRNYQMQKPERCTKKGRKNFKKSNKTIYKRLLLSYLTHGQQVCITSHYIIEKY